MVQQQVYVAEERISHFEDGPIAIMQSEQQREKNEEKWKTSEKCKAPLSTLTDFIG